MAVKYLVTYCCEMCSNKSVEHELVRQPHFLFWFKLFVFLQVMSACCLFLAGKVEETPKKCKDIIRTVQTLLSPEGFQAFGDDPRVGWGDLAARVKFCTSLPVGLLWETEDCRCKLSCYRDWHLRTVWAGFSFMMLLLSSISRVVVHQRHIK